MRSIEELIRQAMEEGKFDDLPGKGRPLRLDENPFEDPEWRMAYQVLHNSGYSLPWLESRREILKDLEAAQAALVKTYAWHKAYLPGAEPPFARAEWERAVKAFQEKITALNQRILSYNLIVPNDRFQLPLIKADQEVERITHPLNSR
jgi:DnaJ family protein C protein 28